MSRFSRWLMISVVSTGMHGVVEPRASAVTISFIEAPNEGSTTTTVNLAGCPGCVLIADIGGVEEGTAAFSAPGGFFAGLPMDVTFAQAILVEPAGMPGEPAGAVSDTVQLQIINTPDIILVVANFFSDREDITTFPPTGFPTVVETGGVQNISANFATESAPGVFTPLTLPANLVIQAQSDVVIPESSTVLLLALGLLGLSASTWMRNRNKNRAARS